MRYTIVEFVHDFLKDKIKKGDLCIDATAGNGHDTKYLCEQVGEIGRVISIDIQKKAVENTEKLLFNSALDNIATVVLDSHENINMYAEENTVSAIMFNLGYLPGGDHNLKTKSESTITALEKSLKLLKSGGILSVCIYSGGDSGFEERDAVLDYLGTLNSRIYNVIKSEFYNKPNNPPIPVFILKS